MNARISVGLLLLLVGIAYLAYTRWHAARKRDQDRQDLQDRQGPYEEKTVRFDEERNEVMWYRNDDWRITVDP